MQDVCIYETVPIREVDASELSVATIALRLLPAMIARLGPALTMRETCRAAFDLAEAFQSVAAERKQEEARR